MNGPNYTVFKKVKSTHLVPLTVAELMIQATCVYYEVPKSQLLVKANGSEHARRKHMLYLLLMKEAQLTAPEVARICNTTRQNVNQAVEKMEAQISIYLQSTSDYRNICNYFQTLQKAQKECLTSLQNNTKP